MKKHDKPCGAKDCKSKSKKHNKLYWSYYNVIYSEYYCRNCYVRLLGLVPVWQQDWNGIFEPAGKYFKTLKELKASMVARALS